MRIDHRTTLPLWSYVPLALLGAGVVLYRTETLDRAPSGEPAGLAVESTVLPEDTGPGEGFDGRDPARSTVDGPDAYDDFDLPVVLEDPARSEDPDVRAEASALRLALDEEQSGSE